MKAKEFMIKDVISVNADTTVKDVLQLFVTHKIGSVPILDAENRLQGIISDGDIMRSIEPKDTIVFNYLLSFTYKAGNLEDVVSELKDSPALHLAKKNGIISAMEDDEMETVVNLLGRHHIKKVPVLNKEKQVVGVISRGDVIRTIQKNMIQKL